VHLPELPDIRRESRPPAGFVKSAVIADENGNDGVHESPEQIGTERQRGISRQPIAVELDPVGQEESGKHADCVTEYIELCQKTLILPQHRTHPLMTGYAAMFLFTTILAEKMNITNNLPLDSSALRHLTPEKSAPLAQHRRQQLHYARPACKQPRLEQEDIPQLGRLDDCKSREKKEEMRS